MDIKLLALAGIMAASMGLAACDSNKENAAEDVADAQEEVADAQEEIAAADAPMPAAEAAVDEAAVAVDGAAAATATTEMDAEVPADGSATNMDMATDPAVVAADEVVVVEPAPAQ